ncbi:MAG: hypothetical protein DWQ53_11205 [Microcystis flos-aquae DF17]|nr:MAG: hypothetical protein DWQ53_11205 [Microcystis flos-aquae DF17]
MEPRKRLPQSVIVVAVIQLIFSLFGVIAGLLQLGFGMFFLDFLSCLPFCYGIVDFYGILLVLLFVLLNIVQFVFSIGLFSIQKWAWYGTVVTQAIGLLLSVGSLFTGNFQDIWGIVICIVILWVMFQSNTRRTFGLRILPSERR